MLGFLRERREFEASLCHRCGTSQAEWAAEQRRTGEPPLVVSHKICPGCREIDNATNAMADMPASQKAGVHVTLEPRDVVLARIEAGEEAEVMFE